MTGGPGGPGGTGTDATHGTDRTDGTGGTGGTVRAAGPAAGASGTAGDVVVRVDRARCVGSGLCAATAPDDLALGEDGRARARRPVTVPGEELTEAAEMCPAEAITVRSALDGRRIAPAL
ncbi:ferredoxin [Streptomyces sp. CB03911]|uniref:ferredoxin n=1 Tax=Streptomyces sp. CB03911 TaxID=1804758 RepID=UPI00093E22F2|nr:ferredoxin [Streptomyces sp. CB03911]